MAEIDIREGENANPNFVQLREHAKKLEQDIKDKDARLKELEQRDLGEKEKLIAERDEAHSKLKDLDSLKGKVEQYETRFKEMAAKELELIPEEHRAAAQEIASLIASPEGQYNAFSKFRQALKPAPIVAGTVTQPVPSAAASIQANEPAKLDPKETVKAGLGAFLSTPKLGK